MQLAAIGSGHIELLQESCLDKLVVEWSVLTMNCKLYTEFVGEDS